MGLGGNGSLEMGQVRLPSSSQRWMEERSKVWPEGKMTGSVMMSSDIGHLKSLGTAVASSSIILPLIDRQQQQEWALFLLLALFGIGHKKKKRKKEDEG